MNNQIIAIWGNTHSGKTTTTMKLAKELSEKKKNIIVVMCDLSSPTLMTVIPYDTGDKSLGNILSAPQITQESILAECITLKKNDYLTFIAYKQGDNLFSYAEYDREKAVDFFILLRHLADYIIVDCTGNMENDILSATALEMADIVFRHITCDLKSLSFYESHLPLIKDRRFKADGHIKILSNIKDYEAKSAVIQRFHGVKYQLPHSQELEEQSLSGSLLESLTSKKGKQYSNIISQITETLISTDSETAALKSQKECSFKLESLLDSIKSSIDKLKDKIFKSFSKDKR
ncbi:MAG: ParA family protein [Clostridia bacterium]|nr:ParA family protein [Clostridia bacterium]